MTLPAPSRLPKVADIGELDGFWYEITDRQGNAVYRRAIDDPLRQAVSLPNEDGTWTNVDLEQAEVQFEVLVPDRPEYAEVRFYGRQVSAKERADRTRQLGTIDLQDEPKRPRRRR